MNSIPRLFSGARLDSILDSYITQVSDDGLDLDRFVEQGAHLIVPEDLHGLRAGLPDLREKVAAIRRELPRLARQIEFLIVYFHATEARRTYLASDSTLTESAFALIYVARDMDLLPDDLPGVGFADDAAVIEIVLERHEETFANFCRNRQIAWSEVQPELKFHP